MHSNDQLIQTDNFEQIAYSRASTGNDIAINLEDDDCMESCCPAHESGCCGVGCSIM
ncbi:hypothetical protein BX661DRAFT_177551 [Kickxella alabastrina]|uniref:uncharacterized protein n=1 Tax=Kickxella alabastrina TaxID=61397 RepID=UPI00221EE77B|nr:uncharacterized protein BX661DRAFT_177551 [Kickxella alabastrina]KAI7833790.1 hypothetical protein BX661DRAFT_177551 [Kickxella alabastrina]